MAMPGEPGFMPIPPPPAGPIGLGVIPDPESDPCGGAASAMSRSSSRSGIGPRRRPRGRKFDAELEVAELDERQRPGARWSTQAQTLSGSNIVFLSRRMIYTGRDLLVLVHCIDDAPVALYGRVHSCEYDGEGLCRVDVDLLARPEEGPIAKSIAELLRSGRSR